jgi:hypothetical protein
VVLGTRSTLTCPDSGKAARWAGSPLRGPGLSGDGRRGARGGRPDGRVPVTDHVHAGPIEAPVPFPENIGLCGSSFRQEAYLDLRQDLVADLLPREVGSIEPFGALRYPQVEGRIGHQAQDLFGERLARKAVREQQVLSVDE